MAGRGTAGDSPAPVGPNLYRDPEAYARAVDHTSGWGTGGAGWS